MPFWGLVYLGLWFLPFALASPLATTELAPAHGSAALRASLPKLPARDRSARSAAVDYSENWAGAVLDSYPAGTFKSVTGTFTVPTPTVPKGASPAPATAWVGIDGDTCGSAILQAGVGFVVSNTSAVSYYVWYEWWPANPLGLDLAIRPGDSVTLSVTATNSTSGTVSVQNHSTGKSATQTVTSTTPLCQQNAEWILEAYVEGATIVPFADFGSIAFTKASAGFIKGSSVGPAKATVLEIEQGSTILATTNITSSTVSIKYV